MSEPEFEAVTARDLYFESAGPGTGRLVREGAPVTVRDRSESEQVARHRDNGRSYEALVNTDDYKPLGEYDVDPEMTGA